jgi:potassium efflux system protein
VARRHPLVQTEPSPDVFFKEFGDSTLNFDLRVFIPSRDIFAQVQHELNVAIEAEFKRKQIEIAFPQRDIYIKNLSDQQVLTPDEKKSA